MHIDAPTIWVSKTVSSVRAIRRDTIDTDEGDAAVARDLTKRVRSSRVRTPSVNADRPIQRIATTCEGIEIGRSCRSLWATKGSSGSGYIVGL
jgi:hypothetical protein